MLEVEGEFSNVVNMLEDGNFSITTYRTRSGKFYHVFRLFYMDPKSKT